MRLHIGGLVLLALGCAKQAASEPAPADPENPARGYRDILAKHVKDGRVDYEAIERQDKAKLDAYLDAIAKAKMPADRNEKIGFLIDAYNAIVIGAVIEKGKPRSVLDVKGFFNEATHTVAGKKVTLDALEKQVLNPFAKDPRTHFVLVCGAVGCPILEPEPYAGSDVDQRMDRATRRYLASPAGAEVSDGALKLSMIFQWYEADFGGKPGVLAFVKKHLPADRAAQLGEAPKVEFLDYNWTLNQQ